MELEIISARRALCAPDLPMLRLPPKKNAIEATSLFLTIAPSFTMALPMLLGFYLMYRSNSYGSYLSMGLTMAIGSACFGGLWAAVNCIRRQRKMRFQERLRKRTYRAYLSEYERNVREHINYEENILRNCHPDFSELIDMQKQRIYTMRTVPDGELLIRLGIGDADFAIPTEEGNIMPGDVLEQERRTILFANEKLRHIPVCAHISPPLSVELSAGKSSALCNLLRIFLIRTALTYHDRKVKFVFPFDDPILSRQFSWLSFLPHCILPDETDMLRSLPEDAIILVIFREKESVRQDLFQDPRVCPVRLHLADPGADTAECQAQDTDVLRIVSTDTFCALVKANGERRELEFDLLTQEEAALCARALCSLKDLAETKTGFPDVYPILRMLQNETENISKMWEHSTVLDSLKVPIGICEDRSVLYLDAHDKRDGPHGLIAGMTGSGKSELLTTYILSLSLTFPPWEVAFFLIDYKGAGMASAFSDLPHVIGSISNLSGHTIDRAFQSIRSENERRQRLFLQNGINHISDYHRKYRAGLVNEALPHIFLIVDEFAQLKTEEPEFMQELIALSRVGRSLGIHLLLCTQKPSGSVDATIMTNARVQIALRLQDPMDSREILRHTDAAGLTVSGRAILRVGNDEVYRMFQCAYALSPAVEEEAPVALLADRFGRPLRESEGSYFAEKTGMDVILNLIREENKKHNKPVRRLWLKELPDEISLDECIRRAGGEAAVRAHPGVLIGLWDDAKNVQQGGLYLDLADGHHFICGMPGSGKSTLLFTFLTGLLKQKDHPDLYVFDFGGGELAAIGRSDATVRYLAEEDGEMDSAVFDEIRENTNRKVVVIDGLGVLLSSCGFALAPVITELLRSGLRRQTVFVISANSIGASQMSQTMFSYMGCSISLMQQDAYRYAEVLRAPHFQGSMRLGTGRGYVRHKEQIVEFIVAKEDKK